MTRPPQPPRRSRNPARAPSNRSGAIAPGVASRVAAGEILLAVAGGADLEAALDASSAFRRLDGADRGFARAIASASLRGQGRIDWALGGLLDRPIDAIEPPVLALLRAGCAQLWLLGSAPYAAVSATVEAARAWEPARRGGGLVNAVLRRASREAEHFLAAPPSSVWPDWLAAKLKAALGPARADAMAVLQLEEPPLDLTFKSRAAAESFADRLGAELLANGSVRLPAGSAVRELLGYEAGDWWVQDAAASLASALLGDLRGRRVVDLCAAPGGKALQLAAAGAGLTAVEISGQRLKQLRDNVARTGLAMDIVEADAAVWRPGELQDAVLLDAPCSALGVLRRHPEGAWRRDPANLARFPAVQRRLLDASGNMLRPGGQLMYCVCTPAPEEGRDVVSAALQTGRWLRRPFTRGEVPGFVHALTEEGDLLTAPPAETPSRDAGDTGPEEVILSDVFYVARLERRS
jgi:16S rRNA (cytosine967-C5)-methyltransferase